jgi:hypothetical protein
MAVQWWEWSKNTLGSGHTIGEAYTDLATYPDGLPGASSPLGSFTDIKYDQDVIAHTGKFIVAVLFLPAGGLDFWQIVNCSGDGTVADAKTTVNAVIATINIQNTKYWG